MSAEGIKKAEIAFTKPIERVSIRRRINYYAEWILSHPILWGWILLVTLNTVADLLGFFFIFGFLGSFNRYEYNPWFMGSNPGFWLFTIPIWSFSIAWAKRFSWKQWIAFAAAWVLTIVGVSFAAFLVALSHFDMSSGPPANKGSIWDVLFPLLCALPGLCAVAAVLRRKKKPTA